VALREKHLDEVGVLSVAAQVGGEIRIAAELAPLVERPLQGRDVELRQALAHGGLRRLERGAHHGGGARQRLRFVVALGQIQLHQRGDVRRQVLAAGVRLPLDDPAGAAAREEGEPRHQDEGHGRSRHQEALPELRGAAGHDAGRKRSYAGLPG